MLPALLLQQFRRNKSNNNPIGWNSLISMNDGID
jgi:hypothetical protein